MSMLSSQNDCVVGVIGMGYVGLTLSVALAECGLRVWGVERDKAIIESLRKNKPHFYEKGFAIRMRRVCARGSLRFVERIDDIGAALSVYIITVGTQLDAQGKPHMEMIEQAAEDVAGNLDGKELVILRSTVQLGTTRRIVLPVLQQAKKNFMLAYCPERTVEGNAMEELFSLPQIVGGLDALSAWRASMFFQCMTPTTLRVSSLEAAEIIKLLDNSFRDLHFAIGNEVALLCAAAGLDGREVIHAANKGYQRTQIPSPGFVGGSCLHKDPHILVESMRHHDYFPQLIAHGRAVNESMPRHVLDQLERFYDFGTGTGKKIAVMGMAFKGRPETSDVRKSPTVDLINLLRERYPDARLCGQDFAVADNIIRDDIGIEPVSVEEGFKDASAVIIATNNKRYQWIDIDTAIATMAAPKVIFDVWAIMSFEKERHRKDVTLLFLGIPNQ